MYDKRSVFLRVHQLRRWNCRRETFTPKALAQWLRMAWAEAKAGTLPSFEPAAIKAAKVQAVRSAITCMENRDRLFDHDYRQIDALRAELASMGA